MTDGEKLRDWLHKNRKTYKQLSMELGVHLITVERLINGRTLEPNIATVDKIQRITGIRWRPKGGQNGNLSQER